MVGQGQSSPRVQITGALCLQTGSVTHLLARHSGSGVRLVTVTAAAAVARASQALTSQSVSPPGLRSAHLTLCAMGNQDRMRAQGQRGSAPS